MDRRPSRSSHKRTALACLGGIAVVAGTTAMVAGTTTAVAGERIIGPSAVDGVAVEGLRGSITVTIGESADVDIVIDGADDTLDKIETETVDGVLRLRLPSGGGMITTNDGNITVVTSGGGSSTVQVGDQTLTGDDVDDVNIEVTVPKGTIVSLAGMVGDVDIGDTEADVTLGCASCKASLGTIAALDIALNGSGEVAVDHIEGSLTASITGGGDIEIEGGDVETAELEIVGSGDIDFGGHAVDAAVSIVGAGNVRIQGVDNPIQQSIVGSGEVVTGE